MSMTIWVPWVARTSIEDISGLGAEGGLTERAAEFVRHWLAALGERGGRLICDARLVSAAQQHAVYLAGREGEALAQSMHVGLGGSTPNQRVRAAGYRLPDWKGSNNVESCASNWQGPSFALERLLLSPSHRPHLLGEGFWEASVVYGVGVAGDYYVVVTAPYE